MAAVAPAQENPPAESRDAWVLRLRRAFSPAGMLKADGSIDQDYFKPKRVLLVSERRWGEAEQEALLAGLEKHGVGSWREIREGVLPGWDDQQLRLRTCRLLGTQSLARYVGWKGNKEAVLLEHAANKQAGLASGCWKGGLLTEDAHGTVAQYWLQKQQQHLEEEQQMTAEHQQCTDKDECNG